MGVCLYVYTHRHKPESESDFVSSSKIAASNGLLAKTKCLDKWPATSVTSIVNIAAEDIATCHKCLNSHTNRHYVYSCVYLCVCVCTYDLPACASWVKFSSSLSLSCCHRFCNVSTTQHKPRVEELKLSSAFAAFTTQQLRLSIQLYFWHAGQRFN